MATQTLLEKTGGSTESGAIPVHVWDDAGTTLTGEAAVIAASAAAPSTLFGVEQDDNPSVEQLADFSWRITINYRVRTPRKLTQLSSGQWRYDFDVQAKPIVRRWAPKVAVFTDGTPFDTWDGTLTSNGLDVNAKGITIQPPQANSGINIAVPSALVSASWVAQARAAVGSVNSTLTAGWNPGEIFISRFAVQQVDDDTTSIRMQWALADNVTNETRGEVGGIAYSAHDYVWEWLKPEFDRNGGVLVYLPRAVLVNRVWPYVNHQSLGLPLPPQKA